MNPIEMTAYWLYLDQNFPAWRMPNIDTDDGVAIQAIWCRAFREVTFEDAIESLDYLGLSEFLPTIPQLVAAAKRDQPARLAAGACLDRLRSVVNSFGDLEAKKAKCDAIDPNMWGTIETMGGFRRICNMSEADFNSTYTLHNWSKAYIDVASNNRKNVVKRKGIATSIGESLGQIMQRRPEIEGGFA